MKTILPVAIGVAVAIVSPIAANASDSTPASDIESTSATMPVQTSTAADSSGALNFEPPSSHPISPSLPAPVPASTTASSTSSSDLFEGGSESLVARTVGAAEGTRTADGGKTQNYHGHVDPGNGVWNRGTFSYQFGNEENLSADEADRRQLAKIKRVHESVMLAKAKQQGIDPLTLPEEINGIDLINQAPLAVTEEGGYIERLAEAKKAKGLSGEAAILEARVWAFWDAEKKGWDAPGLRAYDDISKEESIRRDQDRRMDMISKALKSYKRENSAVATQTETPTQNSEPAIAATSSSTRSTTADDVANAIIFGG